MLGGSLVPTPCVLVSSAALASRCKSFISRKLRHCAPITLQSCGEFVAARAKVEHTHGRVHTVGCLGNYGAHARECMAISSQRELEGMRRSSNVR